MDSAKTLALLRYLVTLVVILILAIFAIHYSWQHYSGLYTQDAYIDADLSRVSTQVDGPVVEVNVVNDQFVKKGQPLFKIDPKSYEYQLAQNKAAYEKAVSQYHSLEAQVEQQKAVIISNQSEAIKANQHYQELLELLKADAVSKRDVEDAKAAFDSATAQVAASKSLLRSLEVQLGTSGQSPDVLAAKANLDQAELSLKNTVTVAPVSGYVTNLLLHTGDYVKAGTGALTLVDDHSWKVVANFRETALSQMKLGDKAKVVLTMYPHDPLTGTITALGSGSTRDTTNPNSTALRYINPVEDWVRLPQRYAVSIHIEPRENMDLRVGGTATVEIIPA
ncbi:MAG: HlyD family secretion protein [Gammaproteobacteria bacterium]|nr:HlyD family secretion protein [Gammaproteobacteria bacterium]